jgi:hypothetical protein
VVYNIVLDIKMIKGIRIKQSNKGGSKQNRNICLSDGLCMLNF